MNEKPRNERQEPRVRDPFCEAWGRGMCLGSLAEGVFEGNYFWINIGFLAIEVVMTIAFPIYLWKCVFYGYFFRPQEIPAPKTLPTEGPLPPLPEIVVLAGNEIGGQVEDQFRPISATEATNKPPLVSRRL